MSNLRMALFALLPVGLLFTLGACNSPTDSSENTRQNTDDPIAMVEIGTPIYSAKPWPKTEPRAAQAEPIVIPQAIVQFEDKVEVPARMDGLLELIGSPIDPSLAASESDIIRHPRDDNLVYRRLRLDETLQRNQVIARIDETQTRIQLQANDASLKATKAQVIQSQRYVDSAKKVFESASKLSAGTTSSVEQAQVEANLARAQSELAQVLREQARLEGEILITEDRLKHCWVYSPVDGRIVKMLKSAGEYVKAGEPIMEVQVTRYFRVEGKLDVQEASRLQPYMPVIVEPTRQVSPEPFTARHRREVAGVAVTAHPGRPLVVSVGLDAVALVWDVTSPEKATHVLPHPAGIAVRSVTATQASAGKHYVATGCADGKVRIWDLSDPNKLPTSPAIEFEESHGSSVVSASFSPDGKFLVTAAGRDVFVWDVQAKKKKYALPAEHRDDITYLQFTPQATLITVARDKAVRVWKMGTIAASLDTSKTIDNRAGTVDVLGVSSDGGRVLFDQDPGRIDLVSLSDKRTVGTVQNPTGSMRFSGMALFSSDDRYVVTAGGDADSRGEMQLWEVSATGGRGSERRRLITPARTPITCTAFSSDPQKPFVVVGTQSGAVHFWYLPKADEQSQTWKGKIVSIMPVDSRSAMVRVEVENNGDAVGDGLKDRGTAAMIIDPTAKPEPPSTLPKSGQPLPLPNIPGVSSDTRKVSPIQPVSGTSPVVKDPSK